jgi:hypothetical protein
MSAEKLPVSPSEILTAMSGATTRFSQFYSENNHLIIRGIHLSEALVIDTLNCQTDISFVDCAIFAPIHINGGTYEGLEFDRCHIAAPLVVYGGTFNGPFRLEEINALHMERAHYVSVGFRGGEFNATITISKGAFHYIDIGRATFKNIAIHGRPAGDRKSDYNPLLDSYISRLEVSPRHIDVLEVYDFRVEHLVLRGILLEKGIYSFGNLVLNDVVINYFMNFGQVRFDRVSVFTAKGKEKDIDPSISMEHSSLGQTRFFKMTLNNFARAKIDDCNFMDVELSETNWFSPSQLNDLTHDAQRDMYRQLKHAMDRQGNRVDELHFQALEMDAYRRTLTFKKHFIDLMILLIGKYTNNYGTNYLLPMSWITAISILVFLCSLWALGLSFVDNWGRVFLVMNPAHDLDYLGPKDTLTNSFIAIDFVGRLVIAVLIYQLIIPFRKFTSG